MQRQEKPLRNIYATIYKPGDDLSAEDLKVGIMDAVSIGDFDSLQGAISIILKKYNQKEITQKTGFSKTTLKKMCLPHPPPDDKAVSKIIKFLTFKVQSKK